MTSYQNILQPDSDNYLSRQLINMNINSNNKPHGGNHAHTNNPNTINAYQPLDEDIIAQTTLSSDEFRNVHTNMTNGYHSLEVSPENTGLQKKNSAGQMQMQNNLHQQQQIFHTQASLEHINAQQAQRVQQVRRNSVRSSGNLPDRAMDRADRHSIKSNNAPSIVSQHSQQMNLNPNLNQNSSLQNLSQNLNASNNSQHNQTQNTQNNHEHGPTHLFNDTSTIRSLEINKEIVRFEGVHPKIFEVYDLLNKLSISLSQKAQDSSAHNQNSNSLTRSNRSNSSGHSGSHGQNSGDLNLNSLNLNHTQGLQSRDPSIDRTGSNGNSNTNSNLSNSNSNPRMTNKSLPASISSHIEDLRDVETIRENLIFIEDFFVKSPEWCLPKDVLKNQIRIGIIGSLNSGKSPLVHHFLTGQYQAEESPEGGRFKKQIQIENDNYLLLLREEGDPISSTPFNSSLSNNQNEHTVAIEHQVSNWVDALVFVFNITDIHSFQAITTYYERLLMQQSTNPSSIPNFHEIPILLVGTQDYIDETVNPRVVENHHARALLERFGQPVSNYIETCATYGLNVEKVFLDLSKRVIESREFDKQILHNYKYNELIKIQQARQVNEQIAAANYQQQLEFQQLAQQQAQAQQQVQQAALQNQILQQQALLAQNHQNSQNPQINQNNQVNIPTHDHKSSITSSNHSKKHSNQTIFSHLQNLDDNLLNTSQASLFESQVSSPQIMTNTPNSKISAIQRKKSDSKSRKSILPWKKSSNANNNNNGDMHVSSGSSSYFKNLSIEREKSREHKREREREHQNQGQNRNQKQNQKVQNQSSISVHPNLLNLGPVLKCSYVKKHSSGASIKINSSNENKKFLVLFSSGVLRYYNSRSDFFDSSSHYKQVKIVTSTVKINGLPAEMVLKKEVEQNISPDSSNLNSSSSSSSNSNSNSTFEIISANGPNWQFSVENKTERNTWVTDIQNLVMTMLEKDKIRTSHEKPSQPAQNLQIEFLKTLQKLPGNDKCADCNNPNPTWASINIGILICIKCSGIHRKLGSHISRVKSLELDDWPLGYQKIMLSIGNKLAKSIWMHGYQGEAVSEHEMELHITEKYVNKSFLRDNFFEVDPRNE